MASGGRDRAAVYLTSHRGRIVNVATKYQNGADVPAGDENESLIQETMQRGELSSCPRSPLELRPRALIHRTVVAPLLLC